MHDKDAATLLSELDDVTPDPYEKAPSSGYNILYRVKLFGNQMQLVIKRGNQFLTATYRLGMDDIWPDVKPIDRSEILQHSWFLGSMSQHTLRNLERYYNENKHDTERSTEPAYRY